MIEKVISAIEHYNMLEYGTTVIAALSGGADSMALLSALCVIQNKYGLKIVAAHVHHGLRGPEADRDEAFVTRYCADNTIELRILKTDINRLALFSKDGTEECGRRIRYDFFKSFEKDVRIATAHTLSDSIETMIFNLARGTALKGLCGIPAVRGNIIRPMIYCTRADIESYCCENTIPFITDSTNRNDNYTRNHIRLNIVPQLQKINPRFQDAFQRCFEVISLDEDLLDHLANDLVERSKFEKGYTTQALINSHPALRKRALNHILCDITGTAPQNMHVHKLDRIIEEGGTLQACNGISVRVCGGVIDVPQLWDQKKPVSMVLKEGVFNFNNKTIQIKIINRKDLENIQNIHNMILDNCFDYDKINDKAVLRNRCNGDKIRIRKRQCTKSLKKLFNENSVPLNERDSIPIIADAQGVMWVDQFGVDQRCEINNETNRIVLIETWRSQRA